ncbi:MAG: SixA phosphatase family protein [Nocardioidaceae bacterium]
MADHRRLLVMRHAKAQQEAETDHDRRLSPRGRRDARAAGTMLAERQDEPVLALVSTAQRARDTWHALSGVLSSEPEVWFDRSLYDAGPADVVELLAGVADTVSSVIVIGHNPAMSTVAAALSDGQADPDLEDALAEGLRTAAVACFDVPVQWVDLNARRLRLTGVDVPRGSSRPFRSAGPA